MAADHPRRASTVPLPSPPIPPPPPLPPARHRAPARSALARLVQPFSTYGSRPSSAQALRSDGGRSRDTISHIPGIGSSASQDASHKTGLAISALDMNQERTHAILAGREIFKTVRVGEGGCAEEFNLRAALINYRSHNATGAGSSLRQRETLDIHDVKWSHGQYDSYIATAAASGKIVLYDINRTGVEFARLHEHHRQVHKLAFNPHQGALLLSASQDATVRLWDLRDPKPNVMTCRSRETFLGMSEGVRDVQWSPTDGTKFAFGTDNGSVQKWDMRDKTKADMRFYHTHQAVCSSIEWHPDGKHLMSASRDKSVKVWNVFTDFKSPKPMLDLKTPYPVYRARWRPGCLTVESHDQLARQCTQIATLYDREHSVVHIWDFRRRFLPFRELLQHKSAPTDMLWRSQDFLWTVGREGIFAQTDVHFAPKVVDRRSMQAFSLSSGGEMSGFSQKRLKQRGPGLRSESEYSHQYDVQDKSLSPKKNNLGRSLTDDSIDDSFLISPYKRHHGRTASNRSAKSFGSTPPSYEDKSTTKIIPLDDTLDKQKESFKPDQLAFTGGLPGTMDVPSFTYLAQKYKSIPLPDLPSVGDYEDIGKSFEQNADYAQKTAAYRVAQSFRMAGLSVSFSMQRIAEENRKRRLGQLPVHTSTDEPHKTDGPPGSKTQAPPFNPAFRAIYGGDGAQDGTLESSSNVSTPLARPLREVVPVNTHRHVSLPDPDHEEGIALPPSIVEPNVSAVSHGSERTHEGRKPERPTFGSPLWYSSADDINERRAMMSNWRAQPRAPLKLEALHSPAFGGTVPPPLERQNSEESFAMFSASPESRRGAPAAGSFASARSLSQGMQSVPEQWKNGGSPEELNTWSNESGESSEGLHRGAEDSHFDTRPPLDSRSFNASPSSIARNISTAPSGLTYHNRTNSPEETNIHSNKEYLSGTMHKGPQARDDGPNVVQRNLDALHRNNQLLRNSSSESDAFLSSHLGSSDTTSSFAENMEASGTIVPEGSSEQRSPRHLSPPSMVKVTASAPAALQAVSDINGENESFQVSDFDVSKATAEMEGSEPFTPINILRQLLMYHIQTLADAQAISHLLLLLTPLLPPSHRRQESRNATTLSSYSEHLSVSVGMSPEQILTVLSNHTNRLMKTGIDPLQAESILAAYHNQLLSLSLFNPAAYLRRLSYPTYPAVYEQAIKEVELGLLCQKCKNPINNPNDKMRCETCKTRQAPCPVCWLAVSPYAGRGRKRKNKHTQRIQSRGASSSSIELPHAHTARTPQPPEPSPATATGRPTTQPPSPPRPAVLWTWCPICGHGGHAACLGVWFGDAALSEGACACASEGCVCDCERGPLREQRVKDMEQRKAEKEKKQPVKLDRYVVGDSGAVSAVRGALSRREREERRVQIVEPGIRWSS